MKPDKLPRNTLDEVLAAIDKDESDPSRHIQIQVDEAIKDAVRAVVSAQKAGTAKKAVVQLTITVAPQGERRVQVSGVVTCKLPKPGTKAVSRFADEAGELFGSDPAQVRLSFETVREGGN